MTTHWVENEQTRKRFWATAGQLGFDHEGVHDALGVKTMKNFEGTEAEAIASLKVAKSANDALLMADTCARLPESPTTAWTIMQSPAGFVWHVTLRAGLPPDLARAALSQMREQMDLFEKGAAAYDWRPVVDGRDSVLGPAPAGQPAAELPPTSGPPPVASGNGDKTFAAEVLSGNVSDGKEYWKVKGGKFGKFGVTIWPEVLQEAGFDPAGLDPTDTYTLDGYTAHYIENDKGQPQKVTKLAKAA